MYHLLTNRTDRLAQLYIVAASLWKDRLDTTPRENDQLLAHGAHKKDTGEDEWLRVWSRDEDRMHLCLCPFAVVKSRAATAR